MLLSLGEKQQLFLGRSLKKNQRKLKHLRIYLNFVSRNKALSLVSVSLSIATDINTADYSITWKYMILPPVPEVAIQQLCGVSSPELDLAD